MSENIKNVIVVSTCRRPFHTRLCLESICRAQRWTAQPWADHIYVGIPANADAGVVAEFVSVAKRNPDVPLQMWMEPDHIRNAHEASKWLLDTAFIQYGSAIALYVEDDAVLSPDALVLCEFAKRQNGVIGVCLYHETIPEQYERENRKPDPRLIHLSNGLNTCGGTAFLRKTYLETLSPNWNCKQVEPRGFDYSAHYLMYVHSLFMLYPDLSRSMNIGFTAGSIAPAEWQKYFGRSIWAQTRDAARDWSEFQLTGSAEERRIMREEWMTAELEARGLA